MSDRLWRRYRLALLWLSERLPPCLEWRLLCWLYRDAVGFQWSDVWRVKAYHDQDLRSHGE
jgi:hypothetical protein